MTEKTTWTSAEDKFPRRVERLQTARRSNMDEGTTVLELSQRAVMLYEKQTAAEKGRTINFACSNSIWKDGKLAPNHRQPPDILAESTKRKRPLSRIKEALLLSGSPW
jgi:hypothetical protein